jgi:hypothetical protein
MKKLMSEYISLLPFLFFSTFLLLPVVLFFTNQNAFVVFYYAILIYMSYKFIIFAVFSIIGIIKYKQNQGIDYRSELTNLKIDLPNNLIAIAIYKEGFEIIKASLDSILKQDYPKDKIHISLSFEERRIKEDPLYTETIRQVQNYLHYRKANFHITIHPDDINGEVPGAASNKSWAVKSFADVIDKSDIDSYIVTIPDADTVFSKSYLSDISYKWLKHKTRNRIFIQPALYKLQNNYTRLRSFTRIISTSLTLSILSSSTYKARHRYTFSCFSLSLSTLIGADYWLTSIAIDDTPFYWRPYTLFDSNWSCEVVYTPISVSAVFENSIMSNIKSQYQQFYRWGWGVITFPIAIKAILSNPRIRFWKKTRDVLTLFENMVVAKTAFITFMLCTFLYNHYAGNFAYQIYQADFLIFLIPISFVLRTLVVPFENLYTFIGKLLEDMIFILPIGIMNLIVFGYLPYLHASLDYARKHKHYERITWSEKR